MKQIIMAERTAKAHQRLARAATEIITRMELPAELGDSLLSRISAPGTKSRNPEIARVFQIEALADFLDVLIDPRKAIENAIRDEAEETEESNRLDSDETDQGGLQDGTGEETTEADQPEIMRLTTLTDEQAKALITDDVLALSDFDFLDDRELASYGLDESQIAALRQEINSLKWSEPGLQALEVPDTVRQGLIDAGFDTYDKIEAASDDDLLAINGIGTARLTAIRTDISLYRASGSSDSDKVG